MRKFILLWVAGMMSTLLALPYVFTLQHEVLVQTSLPLVYIVLLAVAQASIALTIALFFGLKLSQKIGVPVFELFDTYAGVQKNIRSVASLAVPLGVVVGLLIIFLDMFFASSMPTIREVAQGIAPWKALLVAPYGGVVEEILLRLFVVSLFAWLLGLVTRVKEVSKSTGIMWTAIILSAVLFGLGHLPATASIVSITPLVVGRAILLNGVGGLVFGWLFWKKGLEYAMVAHFTADIVLHVILPLV
ncbi:TPA: CPBP family intramembrane metalloprotease [Patescibacteria group bacterium]|nr:CPBP family intramembrane metalloprotease [Patescibacteria group bacterium]